MRGWRGVWVLAVAIGIAAIGAGCGSGSDSTQVTVSSEIDKPTYLKKAEAVCKQANIRIQKGWENFVKSQGGDPTKAFETEEASNEFASTVILPNKQKQVDEMQELPVPEGDEDEVEAILAAYQEGVDIGDDDPAAVMSSQGVFKYAAKTAENYGLRECRW